MWRGVLWWCVMSEIGFEPMTPCTQGRNSDQAEPLALEGAELLPHRPGEGRAAMDSASILSGLN